MTLYFAKKSFPNQREALSVHEEAIIKGDQDLKGAIRSEFVTKLLGIKEDYWLLCDCNERKPIIIICKKSSGVVYLRSRTKTDHTSPCLFAQSGLEISEVNSSIFLPKRRVKTFSLYTQNEVLSVPDGEEEARGPSTLQNVNRLGQILYTLIDDGGLNVFILDQEPVSQLQRLKEALQKKTIDQKIPLADYYHFALTEKSLDFAYEKLKDPRRVLNHSWPPRLKPFVLFMTVSPRLTTHEFFTRTQEPIKVDSEIRLPSKWINREKSSPYLVLAALTLDHHNMPYFRDAFALPILSDTQWIPLESSYERSILKMILGAVRTVGADQFKIEKPLFCYSTDAGHPYRPDFIIYSKS